MLLEDPDGAPYPEPVQEFWSSLRDCFHSGVIEGVVQSELIAALESVRGEEGIDPNAVGRAMGDPYAGLFNK